MQYHLGTRLNGKTIDFMEEIDDPFVRVTVRISVWDLLKSLFRRKAEVEVLVGGDREAIQHVMREWRACNCPLQHALHFVGCPQRAEKGPATPVRAPKVFWVSDEDGSRSV